MHNENLLIVLATILILGIGAQWIAWYFHAPPMLLLMIAGFIAGPATNFLKPDLLLGNLLSPIISLSVAIILFEGGTNLRIKELKTIGSILKNIIIIGVLVTWLLSSFLSFIIIGLNLSTALLFGAIITVTGPTVIGPMLLHIRPLKKVGSILKWEGILIDPVGAMLAVLIFEVMISTNPHNLMFVLVFGILKTIFVGSIFGLLAALVLILLIKFYLIPEFLQNPVALSLIFASFTLANSFQKESGLLAATIMGIALANQKSISLKHIFQFNETLRVFLISILFIILAAKFKPEDFTYLNLNVVIFLLLLIFLVRPAAIFLATINSDLTLNEKIFLSWLAPRGIVAAGISSILSLALTNTNYPDADKLLPLTFLVIIATIAVYGITAHPLAIKVKVCKSNPQGILFVGAHSWAREIAKILFNKKFQVLMVDTNWNNINLAKMNNLPAHYGNIVSENIFDEIELDDIGKLVALTSNDEINSLASLHFKNILEETEVYQLSPFQSERKQKFSFAKELQGRFLFGENITYSFINNLFLNKAKIVEIKITSELSFDKLKENYSQAIPLFLVTNNNELKVFTSDKNLKLHPEETLISIVLNKSEDNFALTGFPR